MACAGPSESFSNAEVLSEHATYARCLARKMPKGTESLGYDVNESHQYLDYLARIGNFKQRVSLRGIRWTLLLLIGTGTGLVAIAVEFCIEKLADWRMEINDWVYDEVVGSPGAVWLQYLSFVGFRVLMAAVAGYLVCFVEVLAAGSGIPEIKCYLNGVRLKNVVGTKALIAKAVGIVCSVAADLPVGKEGPMIHSGAIIGALATRMNLRRHIKPFSVDIEKRDLVAAGAASGVAAAFGAPVGGVLFAIEEGASHMNPAIMSRLFVSCTIAALVSRLFSSLHSGLPFGHLGASVPVSFGKFFLEDYELRELLGFTVLAVVGGICGSLFNAMNKWLTLWRQRHVGPHGCKRFLEVLLVDLLIASILFWMPVWGEGGGPRRFEPKAVVVNSTGSGNQTRLVGLSPSNRLFWQTGTESMNALFHDDTDFDWNTLLIFAILNFELSCLTYGLGVPSGLFVPSLLTGATYGRLLGQMLHFYFDQHAWAHCGIYSLIGACANLAGTARITISLAMILIEATGNATFCLPIFYAVMVAKWTGDAFKCITKKGIYDMHIIELKHVPLLEQKPEKFLFAVQVRQVMARNPVSFQTVELVSHILDTLSSCTHNGFPVLFNGTKHLAGMVRRTVLLRLLEHCQNTDVLQEPSHRLLRLAPIRYEDIAMVKHRYNSIEELRGAMGTEYLQHRLDLLPYISRNGYVMPQHASVASCYMLFRQLGLRHLPVIATNGDVCGIVTRKDLISCEEEQVHQHPARGRADNDQTDGRDSETDSSDSRSNPESPEAQVSESEFFGGGGM